MPNEKPFIAIEIRKKDLDLAASELESKSPHELMVATLANDDIPIHYCSGVLLKQNHLPPTKPIHCDQPDRFADILEQGRFCVEIPVESMTSDLMTEKLLKTAPENRSNLLGRMMHKYNIPRVIIVAPQSICAYR